MKISLSKTAAILLSFLALSATFAASAKETCAQADTKEKCLSYKRQISAGPFGGSKMVNVCKWKKSACTSA